MPYINLCNIFFEKLIFPQISIFFQCEFSDLYVKLCPQKRTIENTIENTGIFDTEEY